MPTDPDDVYATCTAAADLIERDGWTRGTFWRTSEGQLDVRYHPGSQVCTIGAIRAATGLTSSVHAWESCAAALAVRAEIHRRTDGAMRAIAYWNDEIAADADGVISLLRDVAAKHQPDEYRCAPGTGDGR